MEVPECPVCLEAYDGESTIPRVLACGHSSCESCLKQLPQKYPYTIRCPACTQLVKYPYPGGASALPKNIDLLRFSLSLNPKTNSKSNSREAHEESTKLQHQFIPHSWSDEFYSSWKHWVLPHDAVLVEGDIGGNCLLLHGRIASPLSSFLGFWVKDNQSVSLLRVTSSLFVDDSVFDYSYITRIMESLSKMKGEQRDELGLILRTSLSQRRLCKAFGMWYNSNDNCVYLVCEKFKGKILEYWDQSGREIIDGDDNGLENLPIEDGLAGFAMTGMEICEVLIGLHSEGLVIGCLDFPCFCFDEIGHVCVDFNEILAIGRKVRGHVIEAVNGERRISDEKMRLIYANVWKSYAFFSPELFFELLHNGGVECSSLEYSVWYQTDVWSLGCILLRLLIGKQITEGIFDEINHMIPLNREQNSSYYSDFCKGWMEKVGSLLDTKLGEKYLSLCQILSNCLNFDPGSRPSVIDVWKCIRELIIKPQCHIMMNIEGPAHENNKGRCLVVGELCNLGEMNEGSEAKVDNGDGAIDDQIGEVGVEKCIIEGVSGGNIKFIPMQGHLDCVTGLAVGGGFLFSSSFDKMINVWSLQDFTHVHSFRGHEHRVMAVAFVNQDNPLCISGDNGGGIFIWNISGPLGQDPLKKWYEEKDWRYSGIHALTVSGTEYLYTGSGDKLIKAWSLQDYTLSCTMSGHKSVVSALTVCDGVLYSGSWDGTIRLWSLNDHSPLTVLGEDAPGNVTSVLSLSAQRNMFVAAHENGSIKIWRDDVFKGFAQVHNGAVFALSMEGKWLFSGGCDKTINVQELYRDEILLDARPIGSIACDSVITALLYWRGKLIVGCADRYIKVYYYGQ